MVLPIVFTMMYSIYWNLYAYPSGDCVFSYVDLLFATPSSSKQKEQNFINKPTNDIAEKMNSTENLKLIIQTILLCLNGV